MKYQTLLTIACALTVFVGVVGIGLRAASEEGALLLPLLKTLHEARLSGSLEFTSECGTVLPNLPPLQSVRTDVALPIERLREIFRGNPKLRVKQEPNGVVRIAEDTIPADILDVRISHISFDGTFASGPESGVYTPNQALYVILQTPEMKLFVKTHDIEVLPLLAVVTGGGRWASNSLHISGSLDDVTLLQALDYVLQRFPGIWVYQNCPARDDRERVVYFRFFYLRNIGAGVFVEG
jgi:hypothetical protein